MSQMINPKNIAIANDVLGWAKEYLMKPHDKIKRDNDSPDNPGPVCPFVKPSVDANAFYLVFHDEVTGTSEAQIEGIMEGYLASFKNLGPFGPNDLMKKALLVIFPNIPDSQTRVLDAVHRNMKSRFVRLGLMVGQFHKHCDEPSVHNDSFKVSISPYPLIAIRHMALHDILFVGGDHDWFAEYNIRYGAKFDRPQDIEDHNKHLIDLYRRARERWQA